MKQREIHLLNAIGNIFNNFLDKIDDPYLLKVCNYLLEGNLFIRPKQVPRGFTNETDLQYDADNFNWNLLYPPNPSMCQLFLQAFHPIKFLVLGYELDPQKTYMDLASKLISSWLEYEKTRNEKPFTKPVPLISESVNEFVWYDHSTTDRVLVMIYFILMVRRENFSEYQELINQMIESIKKHGEYLYDDDNYTTQNHGTMIDRALYVISVFLDDENSLKYKTKSLARLQEAMERDFSKNMVNVENSVFYHLFTLDLFITLEKSLLNPFGDTLGKYLSQDSLEKSIDYLIYLSKPDLNFPIVGDASKWNLEILKKHSFYEYVDDYAPLEYLLTKGEEGSPLKNKVKIYEDEGYAFFRNSWDVKNTREITYASFISGFSVKFHKHADDLSFTLFTKDKDIFVDAGTYTYEKGDYRRFFMSALAHNTIIVDDKSYPFIEGNSADAAIIDQGMTKKYSYVVGKNDIYDGVNITRSLYYFKNGDIMLIDDLKSHTNHKYSQYYHLGSKFVPKQTEVYKEDNLTCLQIKDDEIKVDIMQLNDCNVKIYNGDINKAAPGIVSEGLGHLERTNVIEFSLSSNKALFVTYITVNDLHQDNKISLSIEEKLSSKSVILSNDEINLKIPIKDYSRKILYDLIVERNDKNLFTFTISDINEGDNFAWYVLKGKERYDVIWYTDYPVLKYLFTEPGDYKIQYFIKNNQEKKMYTYPEVFKITEEDISKIKHK